MTAPAHRVVSNLARVRERMAAAAKRSGRDPADVRLVAVTKYVDAEIVRQLVLAGCREIAESRPQQLWEKADQLRDLEIRWHLIGHLQRNKVQRTLPQLAMIHSVDSLRLLRTLQDWTQAHDRKLPLLIEVNISQDEAKHGFRAEDLEQAVQQAIESPLTEPLGLMCMASRDGGLDEARRNFADLRGLRDAMRDRFAGGPPLRELSMGMSRDFEIAIEEGATLVRVGSTLYEGLGD